MPGLAYLVVARRTSGEPHLSRPAGAPDVLVVLAHPDPASLNASLARAALAAAQEQGARTVVHDLYADGFDPRLQAGEIGTATFADELCAAYARDLQAADMLVLVHPVWFFHVPAVMKGWVDRVVREDVAFELDERGGVSGLLKAKAALVLTTGNSSPEVERAAFADPVTRFWRDVVLGPAGVNRVERLGFSPVRDSDQQRREGWLASAAAAVRRDLGSL